MTGKIKVLDLSGHTTIEFDTEVPESLEVATEAFRRQLEAGYMATALVDGKRTQIKEFDVGVASEITMVPALQGG